MPEWHELRDAAMRRANGACEYCGALAVHVHHVTYPKFRGSEHPDTLIAICADCHDLSHGKKPMNYPVVATQPVRIEAFSNKPISIVPHNKHLYATDAGYCDGMGLPTINRPYFCERIAQTALLMTGTSDEPIAIIHNGLVHYRLHVALKALENWYHEVLKHDHKITGTRAQIEALKECRNKYLQWQKWMWDLASKELGARAAGGAGLVAMPNHPVADVSPQEWLASFRQALGFIAPKVAEHDSRLARVEAVVHRDPTEYVTVRQACIELAALPEQVVYGRVNLETRVGALLREEGAEHGPEVITRLSGNALSVPVRTWRRADAYRVIGKALGNQFDQRLLPLQ